ncbi:MAG: bifunctional phosphopantothenoylcysteine decarboxylase/phosphopantothenate--cysteine ligase CoaBC [Eubacterium sp.]|nr:bifunctional phosphopantothenoylcysteine decarboxylase/phosphopantothenate--cysteine ligase CoaBC [Eubacterium sp.]
MLKGKTVVLGVTGSIAAYKTANLASALKKLEADVHVIMTKNATNFINPITFETLTGNKCLVDTFDRDFEFSVEHVSLADKADVFIVAPCTANVIGKIASGIADDMLTTTIMACKAKKIISPAMNTNMFENPIVQDNIEKLKKYDYEIIDPAIGYLACGDTGKGKMPEPEVLLEYILKEIACEKDLEGKNVLITAGPTREAIDPVRFISNHSTGTMGYALAKNAMRRGANVTLVTGPTNIEKPMFVDVVEVISADEMFDAVDKVFDEQDIVIMSAAVADYKPKTQAKEKIKKSEKDVIIEFEENEDILFEMSKRKKDQFLVGFAMETENMIENSRLKLEKKNLDLICANNLKTEGAGFGTDTNVVTLITKTDEEELPKASKDIVSSQILDKVCSRLKER